MTAITETEKLTNPPLADNEGAEAKPALTDEEAAKTTLPGDEAAETKTPLTDDEAAESFIQRLMQGHEPPPEEEYDPFPSVEERPCYRAYEEKFTRPNGSIVWPGVYYHGWKAGKKGEPDIIWDTFVCALVDVLNRVRNDTDQGWGRLLEFKDHAKNIKRIIISDSDFHNSNRKEIAARLADEGLFIAPTQGPHAIAYIEQYRIKNYELRRIVDYTGWYGRDLESFVLPDYTIGNDSVLYHHSGSSKAVTLYSSQGAQEDWQSNIADYAIGNPRLLLALGAAFAGPLFKLLNRDGAGIHFHGKSSTGKSTSLSVGASVWGHGKEFRLQWNGTANGFEGAAKLRSDTLLCLDEIHTGSGRDIDRSVYSLINGEGRSRASRSGQAKEVARWSIVIISTGEVPIKDAVEADGGNYKAGQAVRILDIPATGPYGMFDHLPGKKPDNPEEPFREFTPREFAGHLNDSAQKYYGTAGPAFVRFLMDNKDKVREVYDFACQQLRAAVCKSQPAEEPEQKPELTNQEHRALDSLAVMATALVLAIKAGILRNLEPRDSIETMAAIFEQCRPELGKGGKDIETTRILESIASFIQTDENRFPDRSYNGPKPPKVAGYISYDACQNKEYIFFLGEGLKEAAKCRNIKRICEALNSIGALERGKNKAGHNIGNDKGYGYKVLYSALQEGTEALNT